MNIPHTCTEGRSIIHIRGFSEGAVCATNVMMVSANNHRSLSDRKNTHETPVKTWHHADRSKHGQFILLLKLFHQQQPGWWPKQCRLFLSGQSRGFWLGIPQPKQREHRRNPLTAASLHQICIERANAGVGFPESYWPFCAFQPLWSSGCCRCIAVWCDRSHWHQSPPGQLQQYHPLRQDLGGRQMCTPSERGQSPKRKCPCGKGRRREITNEFYKFCYRIKARLNK